MPTNCPHCRQRLPKGFQPPISKPIILPMPTCGLCFGVNPPRKIVWRNGYSYAVPCDHSQQTLKERSNA